jgi:REP element-mobilizing transposase RayT
MRNLRAQAPGLPFHVTTRIQGQVHLFTPAICDSVASIIAHGVSISDSRLLALKVMPNHLHVVLFQGPVPLGWIFQPILQRIARLVQLTHGLADHVFGRRFSSSLIDQPDYVRVAIAYTHRNAFRAGLCANHAQYRWTSHRAYCADELTCPWEKHVDSERGLRLFARSLRSTRSDLRTDYLDYLKWWDAWDEAKQRGENPKWTPPAARAGDQYWREITAQAPFALVHPQPDLGDAAALALAEMAPTIEIAELRGSQVTTHQARLRRRVMNVLRNKGYRPAKIARFFKVSPSAVSLARCQDPWPE